MGGLISWAHTYTEPYNKIVGELPEIRKDTVSLVKQAMAENRRAYVLVNNRSDGNARLTVSALRDSMME